MAFTPTTKSPTHQTAVKFIQKYGRPQFISLLDMFKRNISIALIAKEFKVSRQAVNTWKKIFGEERILYYIHTDIQRLLNIEEPSLGNRTRTVI